MLHWIQFNNTVKTGVGLFLVALKSYVLLTLTFCNDICYRTYCDERYQNGHCTEMCNTEECQFDGGDCEKQENKRIVRINDLHYWHACISITSLI